MDFFRSRLDNIRAHPFQNIASTIAGGLIPGGGLAAQAGFNRYNDSRFNNSAQTLQNRATDMGNLAGQSGFDRPLNGPNALVSGLSEIDGGRGPDATDQGLMQALQGSGGGQNAGGMVGQYHVPSQWTPQTISGWNPNQANAGQNFGLLDFLGPNPNQQSGPMSHADRIEARDNAGGYGDFRNSGNYGVSNFMVGGSPVIGGVRPSMGDMNGLAVRRRTPGY